MIPMITTKKHRYAGKLLQAGDAFQARGKTQARLLKALGVARQAVPAPRGADGRIVFPPKVEPAEFSYEAQVYVYPEKPKRQYKRRDMTAEGT